MRATPIAVLAILLPSCGLFAPAPERGTVLGPFDFERNVVWEATLDAIQEEGFRLTVADPFAGRFVTERRVLEGGQWGYEIRGAFKGTPGDFRVYLTVERSEFRSGLFGGGWHAVGRDPALETHLGQRVRELAEEKYRQGLRTKPARNR